MLRENTLFGVVDKVEIAIERLRTFEPAEGYYLAFSGGKDSCVILDLAKRAGVKFDSHYQLTTVDPPELVRFIKKEHPEVEIDKPEKTMWQVICENRSPPTRIQRFCCRELKESGGSGRLVVTGIRWAESSRRSKRQMTEACMRDKSKTYLHPIIDWTEDDVWYYIRRNNLPYCSLYDEGQKRIGCVMCPMGHAKGMKADAKRWPKIADAYKRAIAKAYNDRISRGDTLTWKSPEEWFEWWISDASGQGKEDPQLFLLDN